MNVEDHPISAITDGWVLRDGSLYLFVACEDGVTRTITVASETGERRQKRLIRVT